MILDCTAWLHLPLSLLIPSLSLPRPYHVMISGVNNKELILPITVVRKDYIISTSLTLFTTITFMLFGIPSLLFTYSINRNFTASICRCRNFKSAMILFSSTTCTCLSFSKSFKLLCNKTHSFSKPSISINFD